MLSVVVSQICKTIGWHSISTTCLQILVDVLHRYLKQLGTNIQGYSDHLNHTFPALEEVNLAFLDMGINVEDLKEYVDYVSAFPLKMKVPKYPLEKKSNLNFLKPGSREVVTRPVHIHEHLPAMYPELSEENYGSQDTSTTEEQSLPNLCNSTPLFKSETEIANKRINQLISEELGRPLRELSCVMMTTSGFLSSSREGKGPEAKQPKVSNYSNMPPNVPQPAVPPPSTPAPTETKNEHKSKSGHNKTINNAKSAERKSRGGGGGVGEDHHHHNHKDEVVEENAPKVKKLAGMKELNKLKAFKPMLNKSVAENAATESPPKPSRKATPPPSPKEPKAHKPAKVERLPEKPLLLPPPPPPPSLPEPEIIAEEKLTTEPNKQKLNIFKRISKVKEERAESPVPRPPAPSDKNAQINEIIEAVVKKSRENMKEDPDKVFREEKVKAPPVLFEKPPPPEPVPEPVVAPVKHTKRKKKQKLQGMEPPAKRVKENDSAVQNEVVEKVRPPKPMAIEPDHEVPMYSIMSNLHRPGIIPAALMQNPLLPRFPNPFMGLSRLEANGLHPEMPNLPLPPPSLMQANLDNHMPASIKLNESPEKKLEDTLPSILDKKQKKKMKKDKREKEKKKRDKKDKLKNKEKSAKKKDKVLKKIKVKNKEKLKLKKEKQSKLQKKEDIPEDPSVPKLKLKLGNANSPQLSPSGVQSPKIVIKPIIKYDEVKNPLESSSQLVKEEREPSPELAKISALISKPVKQKSQPKTVIEPFKSTFETAGMTVPTKSKKNSNVEVKHKNKEKQGKHKKSGSEEPKVKKPAAFYYDADGNQVWVCPSCGVQDDGSPMIGCDGCDAWYHWVCVGIKSAPDSAKWFCGSCAKKHNR